MLGRRFAITLGFLIVLALAVTVPLLWYYHKGIIVVFPAGQDRLGLIGVFLAAATLAITAVALVVAPAAVVGYSAIKDAAEKKAEEAAERLVKFYIKKEGWSPPDEGGGPTGEPPAGGASGRPGGAQREEKAV